jgi:Lysylphosphatidylglycerol synthase TM region
MRDAANGMADALERAAAGLVEAVSGAALGWVALAVVLHLANQVARGRGWCAIVGIACPGDPRLRPRDAVGAWVAGAGMGGVLSARGGDAVRLVLLRRRLPDAGYPLLTGTLVAEAAGETAIGVAVVALLLAGGLGPGSTVAEPALVWIVPAAFAILAAGFVLRSRWGPLRRLIAGVGRGCSALREPRLYARAVLPWQLASRLLRAASLMCFLAAFGLPATPEAVALVMLAQGGGRAVPLAPASVAATAAVLAAGFPSATGVDVSAGVLAGFVVGMSTTLTLIGVVLAALIAVCIGYRPKAAMTSPNLLAESGPSSSDRPTIAVCTPASASSR